MTTLYKDRQWEVTDSHLQGGQRADAWYKIPVSSLGERGDDGRSNWIEHVLEKLWVDGIDFVLAFDAACRIHAGKFEPGFTDGELIEAVQSGLKIAAEKAWERYLEQRAKQELAKEGRLEDPGMGILTAGDVLLIDERQRALAERFGSVTT